MNAQVTGETGKGLVEPVLMADFVGLLNDALQRRAQVLYQGRLDAGRTPPSESATDAQRAYEAARVTRRAG